MFEIASQDAISRGVTLIYWKLQNTLFNVLQSCDCCIIKSFVAALLIRFLCHWFTHFLLFVLPVAVHPPPDTFRCRFASCRDRTAHQMASVESSECLPSNRHAPGMARQFDILPPMPLACSLGALTKYSNRYGHNSTSLVGHLQVYPSMPRPA